MKRERTERRDGREDEEGKLRGNREGCRKMKGEKNGIGERQYEGNEDFKGGESREGGVRKGRTKKERNKEGRWRLKKKKKKIHHEEKKLR